MAQILAANRWTRIYFRADIKYRIDIKAELEKRDGNGKPIYSITANIDRRAGNNRWVSESGGCLHDEIIAHYPELQPLVDVHLSDADGVPMHAYENAAYHAGHSAYKDARNIPVLARHLRVPEAEAAWLIEWVEHYYGSVFATGTFAAEAWRSCCAENELLQRWAVHAADANELLIINEKALVSKGAKT